MKMKVSDINNKMQNDFSTKVLLLHFIWILRIPKTVFNTYYNVNFGFFFINYLYYISLFLIVFSLLDRIYIILSLYTLVSKPESHDFYVMVSYVNEARSKHMYF